jgi:hypothetical protein
MHALKLLIYTHLSRRADKIGRQADAGQTDNGQTDAVKKPESVEDVAQEVLDTLEQRRTILDELDALNEVRNSIHAHTHTHTHTHTLPLLAAIQQLTIHV